MKHTFSVYEITNSADGSVYIGQSIKPWRHWRDHLRRARNGEDLPLYAAIRRYGEDCFRFEIRGTFDSRATASQMEVALIEQRRAEAYNQIVRGHTDSDYTPSVQRISSLREAMKAMNASRTPEEREAIAKQRQSGLSIDQKSEIAKARAANMSEETKAQLAAFRSARMKAEYEAMSPEERAARAMKAQASRSPELTKRISAAAIAARKRNAELRRQGLLPPTAQRKDRGTKRKPQTP
jgi:hypothetical protein